MNVDKLDENETFFPQITPLIDVILLVLIFFMITSTYSNIPKELSLELPEAGVSDKSQNSQMRVFVTENGRYRVKGQWIKQDKLLSALKTLKNTQENTVLLISADARAEHQYLINAIVQARRAGIQDFGFEIVVED